MFCNHPGVRVVVLARCTRRPHPAAAGVRRRIVVHRRHLGEGEALSGRPFQQLGESSRRYLSLQVGQTAAHHLDDHRQRVLPVELAEQSLDYVGVAELSHQVIGHSQQ